MEYGYVTDSAVSLLASSLIGKICSNRCNGTGAYIEDGRFKDCACVTEFKWRVRLIGANIPRISWDWTLDKVLPAWKKKNVFGLQIIRRYIDNLDEVAKIGGGLFIQGASGTGKSIIASIILQEVLKKDYTGYYITMSDLTRLVVDSMFKEEEQERFLWIKNKAKFLVIDELDKMLALKDKERASNIYLSDLFTYLYDRAVCLIAVSDVPKRNLHNVYAENIRDKFSSLVDVVLHGESFRISKSLEVEKILGLERK